MAGKIRKKGLDIKKITKITNYVSHKRDKKGGTLVSKDGRAHPASVLTEDTYRGGSRGGFGQVRATEPEGSGVCGITKERPRNRLWE